MRRFTKSNIIKLAEAFRAELREYLEPTVLRHIDDDNAREIDGYVCHSHDATDANEAMADAWLKVFGCHPNVARSESADTWTAAWDLAKAKGFANADPITDDDFDKLFTVPAGVPAWR